MSSETKQSLILLAIAVVLVAVSFAMESGDRATQVFLGGVIAAVIAAVLFARSRIGRERD